VRITRTLGFLALAALGWAPGAALADPLTVVTTTPDLGELAREVGGDEVEVTALVKGPQDPHFVEPRPSFIRRLHDADLYVEQGMDLEVGWAPVLLRSARNSKIVPGGRGYLSAATAIRPLQVPQVPVDRSMGDIHVYGNPHYLVDPVRGLRVAARLRERLIDLRPGAAETFRSRYAAFARRLMERLVGAELAARHTPEALVNALEADRLDELQGDGVELGGWLARARAWGGPAVAEDHQYWIYFARRFGLEIVATLEPKPGIAPTSGHLREVVDVVKARNAAAILATAYFDPRHARWVAERTGAGVARMAHQVGSREGADDYLAMVDYNVREMERVLRETHAGEAGEGARAGPGGS